MNEFGDSPVQETGSDWGDTPVAAAVADNTPAPQAPAASLTPIQQANAQAMAQGIIPNHQQPAQNTRVLSGGPEDAMAGLVPTAIDMGFTTAGVVGGGLGGSVLMGPGAGTAIGASGGGMAMNALAQKINQGLGLQGKFRTGEMLASGIPGGGGVVSSAAKGLVGTNLQSLMDEGKFASAGQDVAAVGLPIVGGRLAKAVETGNGVGAAEAAAKEQLDSLRVQRDQAHIANGYIIPPQELQAKSGIGESTGGTDLLTKQAGMKPLKYEATLTNQQNSNSQVAQAIGANPEDPLSPTVFESRVIQESQPYARLAAIDPSVSDTITSLQKLREKQTNYYYDAKVPGNRTAALEAAEALQPKIDGLDNQLQLKAAAAGDPKLYTDFVAARKAIAMIKTAQSVTSPTGEVDAPALANLLAKGRPLTGGLKTVAEFAKDHDNIAQPASQVAPPAVRTAPLSRLAIATAVGGGLGHSLGFPGGAEYGAATGAAIAAKGTQYLSQAARNYLLSQRGMKNFGVPSYGNVAPSLPAMAAQYAAMQATRTPTNIPPYLQPNQ